MASNGSLQPIHIGGIALPGGASMMVDSVTGRSATNHDVLEIPSGGVAQLRSPLDGGPF